MTSPLPEVRACCAIARKKAGNPVCKLQCAHCALVLGKPKKQRRKKPWKRREYA